MFRFALPIAACALFAAVATPAFASEETVTIVIKDHKFDPAEVKVPAGKRIIFIVDNQDPSSEEFESGPMKFEKIIGPKKKMRVFAGPLEPGRYNFFGEFHQETAQGTVIVE